MAYGVPENRTVKKVSVAENAVEFNPCFFFANNRCRKEKELRIFKGTTKNIMHADSTPAAKGKRTNGHNGHLGPAQAQKQPRSDLSLLSPSKEPKADTLQSHPLGCVKLAGVVFT